MEAAISGIIFVLLLFLQNIHGQQGVSNGKINMGSSMSQQIGSTPYAMNNPGYQFNLPQQGNMQQANPQQHYLPPTSQTGNLQPQLNIQDNQQNQMSDIFSALHNIRQYQTSNTNPSIKCGCPSKSAEQPPSFAINQPINQLSSQPEATKTQPSFNFQFVPVSPQNGQQNSQYYLIPAQNPQNQQSSEQANYLNQPTNVATPQTSTVQSSVSSSQVNPVQSQPIVFALQSPQYSEIPVSSSSAQTPLMFNLQSQQSGVPTQGSSKTQTPSFSMDGQSIMSLLMSQFQNPTSNMYPVSGYSNKQEKPSGMKALLPLIFNMLNERRSCCNQCGCPCSNQGVQEPTIHSGYSNQMDYSQNHVQKDEPKISDVKETNVQKSNNNESKTNNVSEETSDEYEDSEEDEEEVSDE